MNKNYGVARGAEDYKGPSKQMVEDWEMLECGIFEKEDAKGARGFKFEAKSAFVFAAIYEFLHTNEA
jgi:hypothetical protein